MSLSRQQLTLIGIFALFLGPVLLVILMRSSWWQYQPSGMKNQGYLVQPPVSLPLDKTEGIEGKWLILYVLEPPCDQPCVESLTELRQIHRAAGRHSEHLAIALLSEKPAEPEQRASLETIYPEFNFLVDSRNTSKDKLDLINAEFEINSDEIRTYILDPMHNVILAYRSGANPADIHKDLKRLLKWADQEARQ
jgi:hypothetical protein